MHVHIDSVRRSGLWTESWIDDVFNDRAAVPTEELLMHRNVPVADRIAMGIWLLEVHDQHVFACWCVRRIWDLLADSRSRQAIEVREQFLCGRASVKTMRAARKLAFSVTDNEAQHTLEGVHWFSALVAHTAAKAAVSSMPFDAATTAARMVISAKAKAVSAAVCGRDAADIAHSVACAMMAEEQLTKILELLRQSS